MEKQTIILFGPPGAGKGTQAELLSDKLGFYLFETSKLLEQKFKEAESVSPDSEERYFSAEGTKYDLLDEKIRWVKGLLNSPPFVARVVQEKVKELCDAGKSLILAGSPRTVFEAERVIPLLKELYGAENIKLVLIEISPEQTIFRNSHRRICELIRHSILFNKETEKLTLCPLDGSKLVKREGLDDPKTIETRLKRYAEETFPALKCIEDQGLKINKINGEQSVSDVYKDILSKIQ